MAHDDDASGHMPDHFDRKLGQLDGLPGVVKTPTSTIRVMEPLGMMVETWTVQTFRQPEIGDCCFVELTDRTRHIRLVLPAKVGNAIVRQRDALTKRNRSKAAKVRARGKTPAHTFTAADRKAGGAARAEKSAKKATRKARKAKV